MHLWRACVSRGGGPGLGRPVVVDRGQHGHAATRSHRDNRKNCLTFERVRAHARGSTRPGNSVARVIAQAAQRIISRRTGGDMDTGFTHARTHTGMHRHARLTMRHFSFQAHADTQAHKSY